MTHHWGYVGAVTSALLFGLSATLNKIAVADANPTVVAGFTYLFAGISLTALRFSPLRNRIMNMLRTPTQTELTFCRKDAWILLLVVLSGSILAPFLFLNGLNASTAVNASLLLNAESLFTVLIAIFFLRERGHKKRLVRSALPHCGSNLPHYKRSVWQPNTFPGTHWKFNDCWRLPFLGDRQ